MLLYHARLRSFKHFSAKDDLSQCGWLAILPFVIKASAAAAFGALC